MKSFNLSLLLLTAASVLAAPASTATRAFKLAPVSVKILKESNTGRIDFTVVDQTDLASSTCSTAWTVGGPSIAGEEVICANSEFSFDFPNGIENIEDFEIVVSRTISDVVYSGQATLNAQAGTSVWICEQPGTTPGTSEECDVNGDVFLGANYAFSR